MWKRTPTETSIICGTVTVVLSVIILMLFKPKFVSKTRYESNVRSVDTGKVLFLSFIFGSLSYVSSYLYLTGKKTVEYKESPF